MIYFPNSIPSPPFSRLWRTYKVDWGLRQRLTQIHPVSFHDLKTWVFPVPLQCFDYYSHWFLMFSFRASSHTDNICAGTSSEESNCLWMYNMVFLQSRHFTTWEWLRELWGRTLTMNWGIGIHLIRVWNSLYFQTTDQPHLGTSYLFLKLEILGTRLFIYLF